MENHNETNDHGASHGNVKEYVTGLILSVILTVIPFSLVMSEAATSFVAIIIIIACAVAQLLVQAVFFLHMNSSSKQSWNVSTGIYTLVIFFLIIVCSMWIFSHLHHNMLMGH